MKFALISDIHGNLESLQVVLNDIHSQNPDARIICAGDIVGYGPDPQACIDTLRAMDIPCVIGNHEEMVLGTRNFSQCVYSGIISAVWTRKQISADAKSYLHSLPFHLRPSATIIICHGNLSDTNTYVSDTRRAETALQQMSEQFEDARILVCGHTHHAALYSPGSGFQLVREPGKRQLRQDGCYVINPGAVGQSRDGKPLARYALLDSADMSVEFRELSYDHGRTLQKLRDASLVAEVVMLRPRAVRRYVEAIRRRWARFWAERDNSP